MRSKKNMQKMHFTRIRLIISRSLKERDEYINSQIQNVCQNPCYAYILCSIIIETRPQKGHHRIIIFVIIFFVLSTNDYIFCLGCQCAQYILPTQQNVSSN